MREYEFIGKDVVAVIARNDGVEIVFGTVNQVVFNRLSDEIEVAWRILSKGSGRLREASSLDDVVVEAPVEPQALMREILARLPSGAVKKEGGNT